VEYKERGAKLDEGYENPDNDNDDESMELEGLDEGNRDDEVLDEEEEEEEGMETDEELDGS